MNLVIAGTMIRNRRISQSMSSMCHWYIRERQRTDDSAQRYARRKRCPFRLCTIETTLCCLQQKYESLQIRVLPITPYLNSLFWEVHDKEYKMSFRSTVWTCVPVHLYRRFLAQSSISVINWASQVRFFFAWMHVAYQIKYYGPLGVPWYLNLLCAQFVKNTCQWDWTIITRQSSPPFLNKRQIPAEDHSFGILPGSSDCWNTCSNTRPCSTATS